MFYHFISGTEFHVKPACDAKRFLGSEWNPEERSVLRRVAVRQ